ncbi:hypothetical protein K1719_013827 [Acacia pycnantha]|nr:hypothetical protein K1719_013827 [Acacia pycnantha]
MRISLRTLIRASICSTKPPPSSEVVSLNSSLRFPEKLEALEVLKERLQALKAAQELLNTPNEDAAQADDKTNGDETIEEQTNKGSLPLQCCRSLKTLLLLPLRLSRRTLS